MTTVFVVYDAGQQRHYLTSWLDGDGDVAQRFPETLWESARQAIKLALADGNLLTRRGDRYQFHMQGEPCELVVEAVKTTPGT